MDKRYPIEITALDGSHFLIRQVQEDDRVGLQVFFQALSETERWFSRVNTADPMTLNQWFCDMDEEHCMLFVAVDMNKNDIAACSMLERHASPCLAHIAHVRIMVSALHRGKGLGSRMILDLSDLASCMGIEKVVAEFVADVEEVAVKAALSLNFVKQATLKKYVKSPDGGFHDLVIMIKNTGACLRDF